MAAVREPFYDEGSTPSECVYEYWLSQGKPRVAFERIFDFVNAYPKASGIYHDPHPDYNGAYDRAIFNVTALRQVFAATYGDEALTAIGFKHEAKTQLKQLEGAE